MILICSKEALLRSTGKKLGMISMVHVKEPRFLHKDTVRMQSSMNLGCGMNFTVGMARRSGSCTEHHGSQFVNYQALTDMSDMTG